jgi:cytochrome c biogenesis protein CcdA
MTATEAVAVPAYTYVEYFHMSRCGDCAIIDPMVRQIEHDYSDIAVEWVDVDTVDGLHRWERYGFVEVPAIVINNETRISKEEISRENLSVALNAYLNNSTVSGSGTRQADLSVPFAFSMGVFSGFSPCLMAILGFILTYTAGTSRGTRDGMICASVFGLGLVTAYIMLGIILLALGKSLMGFWIVSIVAGAVSVLMGLNLLGITRVPVTMDGYVRRTAQKYVGSMAGLFALGILFSMVKVPCAAPFMLLLVDQLLTSSMIAAVPSLIAFAVGVLTPFLVIGLAGGYALSERVRSYKKQIQSVSGMTLIFIGIWIAFI